MKIFKFKLSLVFTILLICFIISGCLNSEEIPLDTITSDTTNTPAKEKITTLAPSITPEMTSIPKLKNSTPVVKPSATERVPTKTRNQTGIPYDISNNWVVYLEDIFGPVMIVRLDGRGKRVISDELCYPSYMTWSPTGEWIAFTGQKDCADRGSQIYLLRPDSSELTQITNSPGYKFAPAWSPDGRHIIYSHNKGPLVNQNNDIYEYDLKNSTIRQLTYTDNIIEGGYKYSPDGKKIAFTIDGNLWVMNSDGSDTKEIYRNSLDIVFIDWSPNGKYIAFTASEGPSLGCDDLYLFDLHTKEVEKVLDCENHITQVIWSTGGEWIWYQGEECINGQPSCNDWKIFSVRTDGSEVKEYNIRTGSHFDLSPVAPLEKGHTFTISNFGNNLRLRNDPALSGDVICFLKKGDLITVTGGPTENGGYLWWQVEVSGKTQNGWIAEIPGYFESSGESYDDQ